MALRYFKEQMPALHVIGAGSLLEFALHSEDFRMPVGRVQYLYLGPLSYYEFLSATGHHKLREALGKVAVNTPLPTPIHETALELARKYAALGGMPSVVKRYADGESIVGSRAAQLALLATYRDDFGKYAKTSQHEAMALLFERAPHFISQWVKYSKIDPDRQPRSLRAAIENLNRAGLLYPVYATSAAGLPLAATANLKKFKLLFLDVGLAQTAMGLDLAQILQQELLLINRGSIAEQLVGQELLACRDPLTPPNLYFWVRERIGSSAEVDFITVIGNQLTPIEVKAGATGRLRSLHLFMEERSCPIGVRISSAPLQWDGNILSVPFYLISELERLVGACRERGPG